MQIIRRAMKACVELPFGLGFQSAFPPARVNFTLCYRCNLNCTHCLQRVEYRNMRGLGCSELSASEIADVVRQTIPGLTRIGFCGGEIFLRRDIMEILATTACRNPVGFTTNGTLIDSDKAREIVRLGVQSVLFSIDGTEAVHDSIRGVPGTYRKALDSIRLLDHWKKLLGRLHPEVSINVVIMGDNATLLSELLSLAPSLGLGSMEVQMVDMQQHRFSTVKDVGGLYEPPVPVLPGPENLLELIRDFLRQGADLGVPVRLKPMSNPEAFADYYENRMDLSGYYCNFPWKNLIVSPYGDVYPCYMLSMGNVRERSLGEIWNGAGFRSFRKALLESRLFPGCTGCCFMSNHAAGHERS